MERLTPIDKVEEEIRRKGVFMLADVRSRKLWFYHFANDSVTLNRTIESLKGRSEEMVTFLIARARARGEIT